VDVHGAGVALSRFHVLLLEFVVELFEVAVVVVSNNETSPALVFAHLLEAIEFGLTAVTFTVDVTLATHV